MIFTKHRASKRQRVALALRLAKLHTERPLLTHEDGQERIVWPGPLFNSVLRPWQVGQLLRRRG